LVALVAETTIGGGSALGHTLHPVIDPSLAPPELLGALQAFLTEYPFETNVFAMTRFPDDSSGPGIKDPVDMAIQVVREACRQHGLVLHIASDRMIVDDLWANVSAHMWACRYGVAFIEDRLGEGINYNLTIEIGGMLIAGRRCALLKDKSVSALPTDLVGKIYKPVDLSKAPSVRKAVHGWISSDLRLGTCDSCPAVALRLPCR
jgi:hypothetical protein